MLGILVAVSQVQAQDSPAPPTNGELSAKILTYRAADDKQFAKTVSIFRTANTAASSTAESTTIAESRTSADSRLLKNDSLLAPPSSLPWVNDDPADMSFGSGPAYQNPGARFDPYTDCQEDLSWCELARKAWVRGSFTATYLVPGGNNGPGMFDLETNQSIGIPWPSLERPIVLTPGFGIHWWNGPNTVALPERVYDIYMDISWNPEFFGWLKVKTALTPGWYSDWESSDHDALRIQGRVIAEAKYNERWDWVVGMFYVDRVHTKVFPIFGFVYKPREDLLLNCTFPQPKFAKRLRCSGEWSTWVYAAGEFGGGAWAGELGNGAVEEIDYTDWRALLGIEEKGSGLYVRKLEIGYVFNREFYITGPTPDQEVDATFLARAGLVF